jgi:hypothetical protein
VLEELSGAKSKVEICRERQLHPQVFTRWKVELLERASEIFATQPSRGDEQARIVELEAAKKASTIWASRSTKNGR